MAHNSSGKVRLSDGIFKQNMVLMSGLFAGPVIGAATGLQQSLALSFVFTLVTVISICFCRLLPKKITFAIRIVLYTLIAAVIYIPVIILTRLVFPEEIISGISLYLAIIITNPLIISKGESRFFLRSFPLMLKDAAGFVLGFDLSAVLVGSIRDILTDNLLWNTIIPLPFQVPAMNSVYGGFIIVGLLAGLFRFIYRRLARKGRKSRERNI